MADTDAKKEPPPGDPTPVILLVVFLLAASFGIHNFWTVKDPQAKMNERINFLKDIALLGFVLMTLLIPRPWPFSLAH